MEKILVVGQLGTSVCLEQVQETQLVPPERRNLNQLLQISCLYCNMSSLTDFKEKITHTFGLVLDSSPT